MFWAGECQLNSHIIGIISAVWTTISDAGVEEEEATTSQLDSHANMIVVGSQATILGDSGQSADVKPFSKDCSKLESVPIVDAALAYDCPFSGKTFILTVRNALHVKSMHHNLIPPFILREAGLKVNDIPRIHTDADELNNETHCIVSEGKGTNAELKIPLRLDGVFSYFETRQLTAEEVASCE